MMQPWARGNVAIEKKSAMLSVFVIKSCIYTLCALCNCYHGCAHMHTGAAGGPAQAGVAATGAQQLQHQQEQQDGTAGGADGEVPRRSVRAMEEEVMEIMQADIERAKEEHRCGERLGRGRGERMEK